MDGISEVSLVSQVLSAIQVHSRKCDCGGTSEGCEGSQLLWTILAELTNQDIREMEAK